MRVLKWLPIALIVALLVFQLLLIFVPEPGRVFVWYLSQLYLPLIGLVTLVAGVIYMGVRKRWRSRMGWATMVLAIAAIAVPFAGPLIGATYPANLKSTKPILEIRVPMDGPVTVGWGGDTVKQNYHAAYPDQRWAYDLVVGPSFNGSEDPEDYGCYGKPVLAPISGVVAKAHDGEPEATPGTLPDNPKEISGNYVLLQAAQDEGSTRYLEIAHLQPASVAVTTGDIVREGQIIGACGNSGNTSEPHVHIHYANFFAGIEDVSGFAQGLPLYFRDHDGPAMPVGGFKLEGDTYVPAGDVIEHLGPTAK